MAVNNSAPDGEAAEPVDVILGRLEGVRREGDHWKAVCPAHPDRTPSLSIKAANDGRVLIYCFAGCESNSVLAAVGLSYRDLAPSPVPVPTPQGGTAIVQSTGLTIEDYAAHKGIPVETLQTFGLSQGTSQGLAAVQMRYMDEHGRTRAVRSRIAMDGDRFRWRQHDKTMLYGLWRLDATHEYVVLVEGESDCHTLWSQSIPALGVPGASSWKDDRDAPLLARFEQIYLVVEPDSGGTTLRQSLLSSALADRVRVVTTAPHKDPSAMYLADRLGFSGAFREAMALARPLQELAAAEQEAELAAAWELCHELACRRNILGDLVEDLRVAGVVGEEQLIRVLALATVSRRFERPLSVVVMGPSSAGKSYVVDRVLAYFDESAHYALTAMSEHALIYSDEPLSHRMLIVYEMAGMQGEKQDYFMRTLLSEGKLRYETVERTDDGIKPRLIERDGPIGLIMTTTRTKLHPENQTRLINITATDTPEQTAAIMAAIAMRESGLAPSEPDLRRWHALDRWLSAGPCEVIVPFALSLARLINPVATRLRRDITLLLNAVKAHALLHRASRELDEQGRIIATIEDYAAIRELFEPLFAAGVEMAVPPTIRETVETVARIASPGDGLTAKAVAEGLGLDTGTAYRRVRAAIDAGYLVNEEERPRKPMKIRLGNPLPGDVSLLPAPELLVADCMIAPLKEPIARSWSTDQQRYDMVIA